MDYVINKQNESMYQPTTSANALSVSGANKIQLDEGATISATGGGNGIVGLANAIPK